VGCEQGVLQGVVGLAPRAEQRHAQTSDGPAVVPRAERQRFAVIAPPDGLDDRHVRVQRGAA
jgi:hypothetical protein